MGFYSDPEYHPDIAIGYLVRRTNQLGSAALEPMFAEEGLTGMQWQVLVSLWFRRGGTAAELARDLGHDKGAMTRLVDTLEQRGWVVRERVSADRRCIALVLTEEGAAVALRCRSRVVAAWNAWLADWPQDEIEMLIVLLRKLRGTLGTTLGTTEVSAA